MQQPRQPGAMDSESRTWGTFCHLATFTGYLTAVGFIAGPLVVWLIKREQLPFVDDQGKEALNFNISLLIYIIAAGVIALTGIGLLISIPAWIAIAVSHLVLSIIAATTANRGDPYRYPLTLRIIS